MGATVEDVHHGDGQDVSVGGRPGTLYRGQVRVLRGGLGDGEGDAEDGVRAELALVGGAVQVDHGLVDVALIVSFLADELGSDLLDDGVNGVLDALAEVAALVAIATLDGLERAVDAPEGTDARAAVPSSRTTSTSTVGLPRESRISRAPIPSITATSFSNRCCCVEAVSTTVIRTAMCGHPR